MVKFQPQQFKALRKVHKGLPRKYEGLFTVVKRVGEGAYKLQLPVNLKIHHVFYVSRLKLHHEDAEDPSRGVSQRAPVTMVTSFDKQAKSILNTRLIR